MSDPLSISANEFMMDLLEKDPEGWARLSGLVAVLGLTARREIEIEVMRGSDLWAPIDSISIEQHRITCSWGLNGKRQAYEFVRGEYVPRWRFAGGPRTAPPYIERRA